MTLTDDEREELHNVLQHYHKLEYQRVTDYDKVIDARETVEEGVTMYPCPCQPIYLDDTNYAVTYGNQYVIDDEYYYDFNTTSGTDLPATYTYINTLEWVRDEDWITQEEVED